MKVLQINAVYGVGSTGVIVEDLHNLCLQKGIDSYVAYSTSPINKVNIKNSYIIGSVLGKKIHAVLSRVNGKQAYFSSYATKELIKYIKGINPDIVHLHNLHSNFINMNMLLEYLSKTDIHVIITLHDCWFYTGGCFHYTAANCDKWLQDCGNCPKKKQDTPAYLRDCSAQILKDRKKYFGKTKNLSVVGVSKWIADESEKTFFKGKDVIYIYNGIDTDFFSPTASDFREKHNLQDKFIILAPANKWLKPINDETFRYVSENLPSDCVIALLGCPEDKKEELPENVLALDYIKDREELRNVYSACDVFANCSREESLSLINVEVQSCGTPVVTYKNTGVQETVDNISGFAVENGNEKEFSDAILKIKSLGKESFSENCRKRVIAEFNRYENYEKYIELYKARRGK